MVAAVLCLTSERMIGLRTAAMGSVRGNFLGVSRDERSVYRGPRRQWGGGERVGGAVDYAAVEGGVWETTRRW